MAEGARLAGLPRLLVPLERVHEAALVEGLEVAGIASLAAAADVDQGGELASPTRPTACDGFAS